ncbi:universal stress protein [Deinococcus marmoris]|uniref:universal stress protein n=1 Tax=Deinococcus marmoris TaxID=249408 RepID=UPI000AE5AACB|nr:universal stress protein [Deinococcus marmoris]
MIVMTALGLSGLSRALMGSVAQHAPHTRSADNGDQVPVVWGEGGQEQGEHGGYPLTV